VSRRPAVAIKLAKRMERLGTETAFEVLARAKQLEAEGRSVIHLEIGEPDFDTPRNIIDAGVEAMQGGYTHYGPSAGMPDVRAKYAQAFASDRGVPCSPEQVVITPGAKPILYFVITALLDEGEECIYPNPGFPIYESVIDFVGGTAVPLPLREENDFRIDHDELRRLGCSPTRSTATSFTKVSITRSWRSMAWPSAPSYSTATPRPMR
jgi:aspartate/methionine/tyrosine aminotransferase